MNEIGKKVLGFIGGVAIMGGVVLVLPHFTGTKTANGVDDFAYVQGYYTPSNACYVDGVRKHEFYTKVEIPDVANVAKLGETEKKDYKVIGINEEAFEGETQVEEFVIPASVLEIGKDAFADCKELKTVRFLGTEEQWDTIAVDSGNKPLKDAKVVFGEEK